MRLLPAVILVLPGLLLAQQQQSTCNYVTLVKCFIDILDDWAWTLYELKENVVMITPEQCQHFTQLDRCVKDDIVEGSLTGRGVDQYKHMCRHDEVVEASETVSDLLTHRKKAGSFLKSYYLLSYACSDEGQAIIREHRECLRTEGVNEMTLKAGTYLTTKYLENPTDDSCDRLQAQLDEYMSSTHNLCKKKSAANLMCKSLIGMFKGIHADKLEGCKLECNIPAEFEDETKEANDIPETNVEQVANDQEALNKARAGSATTISQLLTLVTAFLILIR